MSWKDIAMARMTAGGATTKDQYLNTMIQLMDDTFSNASDVGMVKHESSTPNVFNEVEARIVARVKNSNVVTDFERKLIFRDPHYSVSLGDLFLFENKTWIVHSTHTNTIPKSCIVQWCNNTAKFVDDEGQLIEIPCTIRNRLSELERDGYLRIPDNRVEVTMKYQPDVLSKINFAPRWTRLLFNRQAYRVEAIDDISNVDPNGGGFMSILLKSDLIDPYDDVENNIADRYRPRDIRVQINNGNRFDMEVGDSLQLDVVVFKNNDIVTDANFKFNSDNEYSVAVDENGLITAKAEGNAIITVDYNGYYAQASIDVVEAIEDNYSILISGKDTIFIDRQQDYSGKVLNNGIEVDKEINWSITDTNGNPTQLAQLLSISGMTTSLKASDTIGTVVLWAKLVDDDTVLASLNVKIKGLV